MSDEEDLLSSCQQIKLGCEPHRRTDEQTVNTSKQQLTTRPWSPGSQGFSRLYEVEGDDNE